MMVTGLLFMIWASLASPSHVLPPVDVSVRETALGEVTITWRGGPEPEPGEHMVRYDIELKTPIKIETYSTRQKHTSRTMALNGGLLARVSTGLYADSTLIERSPWIEAQLLPPPGYAGTSVTNLSCAIYVDISDAVCLNCSCLTGKKAPGDTKYFLFYRNENRTGECQQYILDGHRQMHTSCQFAKTYIGLRYLGTLVVYVNGSSRQSTIQPFYQLFSLDLLERIQPPQNITVLQEEESLVIQWEAPRSPYRSSCFKYEVKITDMKTGKEQVQQSKGNMMNIARYVRSQHSVHVRATGTGLCRENARWSDWSEPVFIGESKQDVLTLVLIGPALLICAMIFTTAVLCRRYQVCRQLFPPVPSPEITLKDVFLFHENGKLRGASSESEVITYIEDLYSDTSEETEDQNADLKLRK